MILSRFLRSVVNVTTDVFVWAVVGIGLEIVHIIHQSEVRAMEGMNWDTFFGLVEKIVDEPDKTAQEKADQFRQRCRDAGCEIDWDELVSWFAYDNGDPGEGFDGDDPK